MTSALLGVFPDQLDGVTYINCGNWVDSCTAVVGHHDGRMELVYMKAMPVSRLRPGCSP